MSIDPNSSEYGARVIDSHSRGLIGSGEVWNQFIDHARQDTVAEWIGNLTPELDTYFRRVAAEANFGHCRGEKESSALRLLLDWYANHPA